MRSKSKCYKVQKVPKYALSSQLQALQIFTNNDEVENWSLSSFLLAVIRMLFFQNPRAKNHIVKAEFQPYGCIIITRSVFQNLLETTLLCQMFIYWFIDFKIWLLSSFLNFLWLCNVSARLDNIDIGLLQNQKKTSNGVPL